VCVCVCDCMVTDTDFSAELNFARQFIGVQGRESPNLGTFAPPEVPSEAQNRTNRAASVHSEPASE